MSDTLRPEDQLGGGLPERAPPPSTVGIQGWMRENLFSGPINSIGTIVAIGIIVWLLPGILEWAIFDATFVGVDANGDGSITRKDCLVENAAGLMTLEGACWVLVYVRWEQLIYGFYGSDGSIWRPTIAFVGLLLAIAPLLFDKVPFRRALLWFAFAFPFIAVWLLGGGEWKLSSVLVFYGLIVAILPLLFDKMPGREILLWVTKIYPLFIAFLLFDAILDTLLGFSIWNTLLGPLAVWEFSPLPALAEVSTHKWGGLMLTIVIGMVGIVLSLPIGVVLALGRRSTMPAVRLLCVIFIEFVRGVPLITLLFMASNMLPLFFPEGIELDKLVRALVVVVAFSAAYMAEVVRGGLQAIPKGQYEAADAMALTYWKSMYLIILPQALKIVIPGIVNSFIGLFKDTTLVLIIGLFDILGMAKAAVTHANWIGLAREAYVFVGVVYFIFCFSMSRYSIWLEEKLNTGHKR